MLYFLYSALDLALLLRILGVKLIRLGFTLFPKPVDANIADALVARCNAELFTLLGNRMHPSLRFLRADFREVLDVLHVDAIDYFLLSHDKSWYTVSRKQVTYVPV